MGVRRLGRIFVLGTGFPKVCRIKIFCWKELRIWPKKGLDSLNLMSTQKTMRPELEEITLVDNDSTTFRIHWYRCNVCGADFEDSNPSHRKRLQLLLEH